MLESWNDGIFNTIKSKLQSSAMRLVHAERNGEAFDSQLVIGVRESYGKWHLAPSLSRVPNLVIEIIMISAILRVKSYYKCPLAGNTLTGSVSQADWLFDPFSAKRSSAIEKYTIDIKWPKILFFFFF